MSRVAFWLPSVILAVAAFVFWHTGARGSAECRQSAFVSGGDLSLWPPGVRCTWGLPATSGVFINPWFFATLLVIVLVLVAIGLRASIRASTFH